MLSSNTIRINILLVEHETPPPLLLINTRVPWTLTGRNSHIPELSTSMIERRLERRNIEGGVELNILRGGFIPDVIFSFDIFFFVSSVELINK